MLSRPVGADLSAGLEMESFVDWVKDGTLVTRFTLFAPSVLLAGLILPALGAGDFRGARVGFAAPGRAGFTVLVFLTATGGMEGARELIEESGRIL